MIEKLFWRTLLFFVAIYLAACTTFAALKPLGAVIEDFGPPRTIALQMQIIRNGKTNTIDSIVEITEDHLRFVATSAGVRLFTLDYDGKKISEGPGLGLPTGLPAQLIINDLTLLLLDDNRLQKILAYDWTMQQDGQKNRLYQNNKLLVEYSKTVDALGNGVFTLTRKNPAYQLNIDSVILP